MGQGTGLGLSISYGHRAGPQREDRRRVGPRPRVALHRPLAVSARDAWPIDDALGGSRPPARRQSLLKITRRERDRPPPDLQAERNLCDRPGLGYSGAPRSYHRPRGSHRASQAKELSGNHRNNREVISVAGVSSSRPRLGPRWRLDRGLEDETPAIESIRNVPMIPRQVLRERHHDEPAEAAGGDGRRRRAGQLLRRTAPPRDPDGQLGRADRRRLAEQARRVAGLGPRAVLHARLSRLADDDQGRGRAARVGADRLRDDRHPQRRPLRPGRPRRRPRASACSARSR